LCDTPRLTGRPTCRWACPRSTQNKVKFFRRFVSLNIFCWVSKLAQQKNALVNPLPQFGNNCQLSSTISSAWAQMFVIARAHAQV
jgi:hypothetical protein